MNLILQFFGGFATTALVVFLASWIVVPIFFGFLRFFGLYAIVQEGTCHVYVLFGKVVGVLREPGLNWLWLKFGPNALLVNWFGQRHVLDMRLDQQYLRSQPVNSEEGAPMGIGVWYEMFISDPVSYLLKYASQLARPQPPRRTQPKPYRL